MRTLLMAYHLQNYKRINFIAYKIQKFSNIFNFIDINLAITIQQVFNKQCQQGLKMKAEDMEKPITARSWIIVQNKTSKYWRGQNALQKLEIASLTKMYTLYACLQINQLLGINPSFFYLQVIQTINTGTLAHLEIGKYIKLNDLYYALMLPSGNDSALLLAYYYGYWLGRKEQIPKYEWKKQKIESLEGKKKYNKIFLSRFMNYLNTNLVKQHLKHSQTHFQNPHGLPDKLQKSTAWEVANAAVEFLRNPIFSNIVQAESYQSSYFDKNLHQDSQIYWQNTNILLDKQYAYIGIKTGHTVSAGNCLASRKIIKNGSRYYDLVIIVLGSQKLNDRFVDTLKIVKNFEDYLKVMF